MLLFWPPVPPLPMGVLAEILQCDASNITGVVDGLESRGLVERRVSTKDRRIKHLTLTRRIAHTGHFVATGLPPGWLSVVCHRPGHAPIQTTWVRIRP